MNIYQADSNTDQFLILDELQDLINFSCDRPWKSLQ